MHHTSTFSKLAALGRTALAGTLVMCSSYAFAQTTHVTVPPTALSLSNNNRAPNPAAAFQRSSALFPLADMNGFPSGSAITTLGFNIDSALAAPVTGTLKVYMVNTTNATYARSNTWATLISAPTAMTLVYDGVHTVSATTGWHDITLTTPYTYTGSGIYMAFEWSTTTPSAESPWYRASSSLTNGVASAVDPAAFPTTLAPGDFRPWIRLGYQQPPTDLAVQAVHALGKLPYMQATAPHVVKAVIKNTGSQPTTNVLATLTIIGTDTFTTTATIPPLTSGTTTTISFPGYTPTSAGAKTVTVTLPSDALPGNNTRTASLTVTPTTMSYTPAAGGAVSSVGYNTGSGLILNRYVVKSNVLVTVPTVRVYIGNNTASVGKTIFGVLLDSVGTMLGRSANHVIVSGNLSSYLSLAIDTPSTPAQLVNTAFFVGMAQTAGTPGYFPVGTQDENVVRDSAYYTAGGAAALLGGVMPVEQNNLGRFMIEAVLQSTPLAVAEAAITETALNIYPNPSHGRFTLQPAGFTGNSLQLEVFNLKGQKVAAAANLSTGRPSELYFGHLSSGVYLLKVISAGEVFTKKLVIE